MKWAFWASLEHKIFYTYDGEVPDHLVASLTEAADERVFLQLWEGARAAAHARDGASAGDGTVVG